MEARQIWARLRKRTFEIIEVGTFDDYASRVYDFVNSMAIVVNLLVSMLYTFEEVREDLEFAGFTAVKLAVPAETMSAVVSAVRP